jgi:hypothetical protein
MSIRNRRRVALLSGIVLALAFGSIATRADEGFWPFNAVPKDAIKTAYGVELSDAWLDHVRLSSVRFGGASGAFVSADGLVLTNHHVGRGAIQQLSTPERDLVKLGFHARTRAAELKVPAMELVVLQSIEDVTARVNGAVKPGASPAEAFAARRAAIAAIEKESTDATGLRSDVVTLYQGGLYHLYRYKRYTDVRLVFAPEHGIAFFGGDPDNFTYPRYNLDIALFRVYEDDRPARIEHYLKWSPAGAKDGELVFTSGHPGGTQRLYTGAHLELLRDLQLPMTLDRLERMLAARTRYAERGPEQARQVQSEIFGIENSIKSLRGQLAGLRDPAVMASKTAAEQRLRAAVAADPKAKASFGDAWDQVDASAKAARQIVKDQMFLEGAQGLDTRLFSMARGIVRVVEEREKPNADRLPEYTEARLQSFERQLYSPSPIYPEAEKAKLADSLAFMQEKLGAGHALVTQVLAGKTPEARATELVAGSTLVDVAARKALVEGGTAAVAASTDPMIQLARAIDADSRAVRKRAEDEVASVQRDAYAKIAQAVFATQGTSAYPDGTSTLRLSYGQVKGYTEAGKAIPPFTEFAGLYERAATFGGKPPFDVPARWVEKKGAIDLAVPFNFVSTNDIVGGNSGSPLVNARGEFVGVAFDGNIQSLPGYFIYDGSMNRTVSVDSRSIIEALRKVYDAGALVDEMLGQAAVPSAAAAAR